MKLTVNHTTLDPSFQIATSTPAEPPDTTTPARQSSTTEASLVDSVLAVAMRHSGLHQRDDEKSAQPTTPLSAPSSHYAVPSSDVSTSSSFPQAVASTSQKRMSIEEERQKRRSNIVESTRAALSVSTCSIIYTPLYIHYVYRVLSRNFLKGGEDVQCGCQVIRSSKYLYVHVYAQLADIALHFYKLCKTV